MPQFNECLWDGTNPGSAVPYEEYTASSSTGPFVIGFPYQHEDDIVVYIESGGTYTKLAGSNAGTPGFSFGINAKNENTITLAAAATGQVHIVRRTELCENEAEFEPGASIRAEDLNDTFTQMRNAIIENREMLRAANGGGDIPEFDTLAISEGTGINITTDAGPPITKEIAVQSVQLWGRNHDHSGAVNGPMNLVGNITFTSGSSIALTASTTNTLTISGGTSAGDGALQVNRDLQLASAATTSLGGITYTWPSSQSGTKVLSNDGSGNLSWSDTSTVGNDTLQTVCTRGNETSTGITFSEAKDALVCYETKSSQLGSPKVTSRMWSEGAMVFGGTISNTYIASLGNVKIALNGVDGSAKFEGTITTGTDVISSGLNVGLAASDGYRLGASG